MVDAGTIFKLLKSNIQVGSSSVTIDRSGSALQILGHAAACVDLYFVRRSNDRCRHQPRQTTPDPGDWGGLIFQNDVDRAEGRFDYEQEGIFLNIVNQADIRYGGGNVTLDSVQQVINPIHMIDARPTVSYNRSRFSADAAMSANPGQFRRDELQRAGFVGDRLSGNALYGRLRSNRSGYPRQSAAREHDQRAVRADRNAGRRSVGDG